MKAQIAIVPNSDPSANRAWRIVDRNAEAVVTYLQERRARRNTGKSHDWSRTVETFAAHVPAGHRMVAIKITYDARCITGQYRDGQWISGGK